MSKKTKEKDDKHEEMSIDSGIPDLENEAQDSDKSEEKIEIADNSRSEFNKRGKKFWRY